LFGFIVEVRPDLGLEYDQQRGAYGANRAANAGDVIERRIEDAVAEGRGVALGGDAAGDGGSGKIDWDERLGGLKRANQGDGGGDFSDRYGVQPDGAGLRPSERSGQEAEALAEAGPVCAPGSQTGG